jgi:anti-sigma B factor antagonist
MNLEITTEIENKYILISIKSILTIENITPLKSLLDKYVDEKRHILIDLSEITFIDSSSLGILIIFNTKLEKNNQRLSLININSDLKRLFKSTELDKHINIFDDIESSMNKLGLNK